MKTAFLIIAGCFATFALALPTRATPVTFDFIPSAAPAPGGGTFTASATFDDSLFGTGFHIADPIAFSASITGNSSGIASNRSWELDEITYSVFQISSGGTLTFSALTATDNDPLGFDSYLVGGPTGFSSPVLIVGAWQQRAPSAVPEGGPGLIAPVVFVGLCVVAFRERRKLLAIR